MTESPFSLIGPALYERGFSPIPIMPGDKKPGLMVGDDWRLFKGWNEFCIERPSQFQINQWAKWPMAGVGVACGRGLICIDIDLEEAVAPLLAILPPSPVQKRGRKGISAFYRGNTEIIRSKNFRTPERVGLVDLLAEGKQTVLPPSVHPDTGEPYVWMTDDHLYDLELEDLPELPEDIAERIGNVLKAFGYVPEEDRAFERAAEHRAGTVPDAGNIWRRVNDAALKDLHAWVPKLGLPKCRCRFGNNYRAVASWRRSGSGRAEGLRSPNLSFSEGGIEDFGTGEKFTALNVVMKKFGFVEGEEGKALEWLAPLVGVDLNDSDAAALAERVVAAAVERKAQQVEANGAVNTATPTLSRTREKFRVTMFDDIEETAAKEWVVEGFLAAGEFTYVVGKPGSTKSIITTDIACHIGAGMDWHGRKVKRGLVIYLAAERGPVTKRRMMAFRKHYKVSGVAVAVIEGMVDFTSSLADAEALVGTINGLGKKYGLPPVWIVVDTLSRTFGGGDQNKSQDMGKFVRAADALTAGTGAHVTVIHHTPWEQDRAKGAIDLDGAVDASFVVRNNNGRCTLRCDGANDFAEGPITAYTLKSINLGTDANGKATDAPVVLWNKDAVESQDGDIKLRNGPKKPVAVVTFEIALKEKGQTNPHTGRIGVARADLEAYIVRRMDKSSNATDDSRDRMVAREIKTIRAKVAEQVGEFFYTRAANDNFKDQESSSADSRTADTP